MRLKVPAQHPQYIPEEETDDHPVKDIRKRRAHAETTVIELNRIVAQAEELLKTLGEEGGAAVDAVRAARTAHREPGQSAPGGCGHARARRRERCRARPPTRTSRTIPWKSIAYGAAAGAAVALIAAVVLRRD